MAATGVFGPHGSDQTAPAGQGAQHVSLEGISFGDVLRAINPLQYLPVVGTIYRVATGDVAPSGLREAVSAVVGVVTGGPIGLLGSIAGSLAEQFLHVEGRVREALVPAGASTASAAVPAPAETATHARAEADLGKVPQLDAPATTAMVAYRAAGLLGAV